MAFVNRISIGANVVLLGLVAVLLLRDQPDVSSPVAPAGQPDSAPVAMPQTAPGALGTSLEPAATRLTPTAMAQLERMGISRDVLVNALLGEFHRRWDQRFADLEKEHAPKQVPEREYVELARLRDAEQVRELKEALGEEGYVAWDKERTLRLLNPGGVRLNADEARQAYRLQKQFEERYRELQMAMEDGFADGVDVGMLHAQAQAALDRDLEQLLGKQRFDEMRGVGDPITEVYRMFGELNPTSGQAQAVLQAEDVYRAREAALARRLSEDSGGSMQLTAELKAMNDAREEHLRGIFGARAYDTMKQQNDPTYQRLQQFAEAWELQAHEIQAVYESVRAFRDQAERTRTAAAMRDSVGQRVDWNEVNAAIEQARAQTEAGLQDHIGDIRLWRLKQDGMLGTR